MAGQKVDIAIFGAGIAGLWIFNRLKQAGYDAILFETNAIGGEQTMASQGIIHSGLKYTLAGTVNELARSISAMPDRWRDCLEGEGDIDLSDARMSAASQQLMIPPGFIGDLVKLVSQKALGNQAFEIAKEDWPQEIAQTGFTGSLIHMDEPVLDIPSVVRALAEPHRQSIRKIESTEQAMAQIEARMYIFTAAASNEIWAKKAGHDSGLETQARPLLMGMIKNAPYELYVHLVGQSDKPVATITTHKTKDGSLVWYLGGGVAERSKDAPPIDVIQASQTALTKYMPALDLSQVEWAVLPIDRIEGKSNTDGWLPDTPTIHQADNHLYCWPTKLTFAPMLGDKVMELVNFEPSGTQSDFSVWPELDYAPAPWDKAIWTSAH